MKHKIEALYEQKFITYPLSPLTFEVLYHISRQIIEGVKDGTGRSGPTKVCTQSPLCF
jgi:hypothetical protein